MTTTTAVSHSRPGVADRSLSLSGYLPRLTLQWMAEHPSRRQLELDATMVFVDVSGFTKLSERLARKGHIGAEELTELIGSCFTRLLADAYADGGSLIKFGGDALLLLFTGEGHAVRGVRAAAGMRRTLSEIGSVATTSGNVKLRMSVGVHSGAFQFFLVGESHRELLVAGPAATTVVRMESTASAGQIVISGATAALLPATSIGERAGDGYLLRRSPAGLSASPTFAPTAPADEAAIAAMCIPRAIRHQLGTSTTEGEHRRITIGFLHYDDIDARMETQGPDVVTEQLDELVRTVQSAADRYEVTFVGSDIDADGGKIVLAAGAPLASENDEARMLRAARDILDATPSLPVRLGVNCGRVFAGDVGPGYRRTYTAMGDAVNLAARVMAKAQPGELLATNDVLAAARLDAVMSPVEPFMVKGKSHPVHASVVRAVRSNAAGNELPNDVTPIIGRDAELQFLLTRLQTAVSGRGQLVHVVGEPGIGKSRLIAELRRRATGVEVRSVLCEPFEATTPYFAARHLLRSALDIASTAEPTSAGQRLLERLAELTPELLPWAPLLADAIGAEVPATRQSRELDPKFRRARLEDTAARLLGAAFDGPTLVVIEDTHWVDDPSAALIERIAEQVPQQPWMWCLTRRDVGRALGGGGGNHVSEIRPAPLSSEHAAILVDAESDGRPLAPHEIETLAARSGGNPLFLRELLAVSQTNGSIDDLPDSIDSVLVARIDQLPTAERTALRRLAVLGTTFETELATAVLDGSESGPAVLRKLDGFLIRDVPGVARFRHALLRDAAYNGLPFRLRQTLHREVGERIEQQHTENLIEQAGVLSLHFTSAAIHDKAWHYSRLAARHAASIYANVEAADFFGRALQAARRTAVSSSEIAQLHEELGDVRRRLGEYDAAAECFRAARRLLTDDPARTSRLLLKTSRLQDGRGRFTDALRWLKRAAEHVESLPATDASRCRAQVSAALAAVRYSQGKPQQVIAACTEAIAEAQLSGEREALAHAYYLYDAALVQLGRFDEAVHSAAALALYEELDDLWGQGVVLNNLGGYAYWRGEWDDAITLYERGRDARERIGDMVNASYGTINIAEILSDQGRLDEAEPLLRQVLRIWRAAGDAPSIAYALGHLGRVTYRMGRPDEALQMLEEARGLSSRQVDGVELTARIAECLLFAADARRARDVIAEALHQSRAIAGCGALMPMLHRVHGMSLLAVGNDVAAERSLTESVAAGRARGVDYEIALTLRLLASFSPAEAAAAMRAESAETLTRLGVVEVFEPAVALREPGPVAQLVPTQDTRTITAEAQS
jgi:class 3 adenylate cyclase/tetratricopeptide (TPR) repeat protein